MTEDDAINVIMYEGLGPAGIGLVIRVGDDPGRERVSRLLEAIKTLYTYRRGHETLERKLAYALFAIAYSIQGNLQSSTKSSGWSSELIHDEQFIIGAAVESVFADVWEI